MSYTLDFPIQYIANPDRFATIGLGKLYIGVVDGDPAAEPADRIQAYIARQNDTDLPIPQPIDLSAGGVPTYLGSPVTLKINQPFSCAVLDRNDQQVYYSPKSGEIIDEINNLENLVNEFSDNALFIIENVAALATFTPVTDQVYYLKEYNSGTGVGGGYCVGSDTGTADGGLVFACAGGKFVKRINFDEVCPEFWGAGLATVAGDDAPTRAALLHPLPCRLSRVYSLSSQVALPANKKVFGNGKATTGLIASAGFSIPGTASSVLAIQSFCNLQNFTVDANDQDGGGGKRLNCVPTTADAKGFFVSNVDVKNCTGYGHVTFGSEANPQVTGYYESCHGYNCQVPFEQIGALDVTLVKCTAEGVAGRTLELFHPYGGSKNVTYISCRAWGESGAGINILTTNGHPVGPIRFIDSSIDIAGAVSAINVEKATGADTTVDLQIIGGSYKSALGSALNLNTNGKFKFLAGAKFQGGEACNMPPFAAQVEFNGAEVLTAKASNTQQSIALVVNSAEVKVVGGRVEATNSGSGGSLAIMGLANVSEQTSLIPPVGGNIVFVAHSAGVINLQADGANGFVNISVPINTSDVNKIILSYSVVNTSDAYPASNSSSWFLLDPANIRIRFLGINDPSMKISYDIKIIQ